MRSSRRWPSSGVALLEQPLARGSEADLDGYRSPIPIAADESALGLADVPGLVGRFDVINIKLDKCGGLTEALLMAEEARAARARRDGRQHGRHQPRDGAGVHRRAALRRRRSRRADLPRARTARPSCEYRDGTIWCAGRGLGIEAAPRERRRPRRRTGSASRAGSRSCSSPTCGSNSPTSGCARCWSIT